MNYVFIWPTVPSEISNIIMFATVYDEFIYQYDFNKELMMINITDWDRHPQFWPRGA